MTSVYAVYNIQLHVICDRVRLPLKGSMEIVHRKRLRNRA
jgi:hypothetical protein